MLVGVIIGWHLFHPHQLLYCTVNKSHPKSKRSSFPCCFFIIFYFFNPANFFCAIAISESALLILAALLFSVIRAFFFFISSAFNVLSASLIFCAFASAALRSARRLAVSNSFCFFCCFFKAFSSLALRSAAIFFSFLTRCSSFFLAFCSFFFCCLAAFSALRFSFLASNGFIYTRWGGMCEL